MKRGIELFLKQYLKREAELICDHPLPEIDSLEALAEWKKERVQQFQKASGVLHHLHKKRSPLNTQISGVYERDGYTIETLYFESLPGLYVAGNLYLPKNSVAPAPAILYLNGHSAAQKEHYQSHAQQLVKLGFATLIIDTIQLGENFGYHHGTYKYGWFHWISRGYSPVGAEVWNAIRAVDLLSERVEVDSERIGVTGNSGGGSISWWHACCDDRIKALAPSCGTGETSSHIRDNTVDTHCDCFIPNNPYGWSLTEMYALVAPRPVLIAASSQDLYFTVASIRNVHSKLKQLYAGFGLSECVELAEFEGPHGYDTKNRISIAAWFLRHLADREWTLDDETIFEQSLPIETSETLNAFKAGIPANDESSTVQEWFIPSPELSFARNKEELVKHKEQLINSLKTETFSFFPDYPVETALEVVHQLKTDGTQTSQFTFHSEADWKLKGQISRKLEGSSKESNPIVVCLRGQENYYEAGSLRMMNGLSPAWLKARLDPRGTGDTASASQFATHLRRSAMFMGRTIPAMMVWDTLRGIEAIRSLPEVDPNRIVLAAQGEMAVVALYAALLDGNIFSLVLENPVGTLNKPDESEALPTELINALRHTDLSHTAAMLYPMPIVFVEQRPETYRYTEEQYRLLGAPGGTWRVPRPAKVLDQLTFVN